METKDVEDIDEHNNIVKYTFVRINKGQHWLFKTAVGVDASRRDLADSSVTVFEDLEKAVRAAAAASSDDSQESAPGTEGPRPKRYKSCRA